MRVLLLTDSLGCPRPGTNVAETWTDRILKRWESHENTFYTYCKHGLSARMIELEYIKELSPDIIIIQVGIVDACRRALRHQEVAIIARIPIVRDIIKSICHKYHFLLTRIRNIHHCRLDQFTKIIKEISNIPQNNRGGVLFINIAPAGVGLTERVYRIQDDIDKYNNVVKSIDDIIMLNPYVNSIESEFLLDDGHHLNERGQNLVFSCVNNALVSMIGDKKHE